MDEYSDLKNLKSIEIEVFSFCNRRCWFCPNSTINRHSHNIEMKEDLYLKILGELKLADFKGEISYSRYNEPLAYKDIILKRIAQARSVLPDVFLTTNTNGDYLTKEYLSELKIAGLNELHIQHYLRKDEIFDADVIYEKFNKTCQSLGLGYTTLKAAKTTIKINFEYEGMSIFGTARDFKKNGNTRGGSVKTLKPKRRNYPCLTPHLRLYIDYNGKVMPCCNLRSDIMEHVSFVIGDANETSVEELFNNDKMNRLRDKLNFPDIQQLYPCNECKFNNSEDGYSGDLKALSSTVGPCGILS